MGRNEYKVFYFALEIPILRKAKGQIANINFYPTQGHQNLESSTKMRCRLAPTLSLKA